jgi:hypothetical protein
MVPATMVTAVHELGWLALLLAPDGALATEPSEAVALLDALIVPDWGPGADRNSDFARGLGEAAEARGLPVLRLPASLVTPDQGVADYIRAIGDLLTPSARATPA